MGIVQKLSHPAYGRWKWIHCHCHMLVFARRLSYLGQLCSTHTHKHTCYIRASSMQHTEEKSKFCGLHRQVSSSLTTILFHVAPTHPLFHRIDKETIYRKPVVFTCSLQPWRCSESEFRQVVVTTPINVFARGGAGFLSLVEISWCYYPNQHICQRGCRIFIPY